MAAASISSLFAPSFSYSKPFKHPPSSLPLCFNLVRPPSNPTRISRSNPIPFFLLHSKYIGLRINHRAVRVSRCTFHLTMAAKLEDTNAELPSDVEPSSPSPSLTEATFDIKLPRRSLLVQFTCDACGERTQRTINRVAYERGTVFVQCSGCLQHHKLVDNLGLIVEYDLREETGEGENSSINQV
ncbi:mitochondrial protein import protein ZIM17 isoform X1 [Cinnamomum micranthum f. kanehirae]|uniref:Mitochondrial protein import protein ZIM17 isoform X1 n=1 Tax=Cinnamomum micranthum f. kanehirae TaxID=337451 RepID=A0A443NU07_9MAGN|nr:mitochondrial protein import protein ZIM17 isoform X1 [Cinnamomum micranthum f. kanehirae]